MIGGRRLNPDAFSEAAEALRTLGKQMTRMYPKVDVSGSQHKEDMILEQLLPEDFGLYVDCGAHAHEDCSNTYRFWKKGWRGLLVEPLPSAWPNLLANRTRDFLCPYAASNEEGFASLRVCRGMSSLQADWPIEATEVISVRTMPLRDILKLWNGCDWTKTKLLSIDCEGHERQVLEGVDWSTFRPEVICIEHISPTGTDLSVEWRSILESNGYINHWSSVLNQIWRRK